MCPFLCGLQQFMTHIYLYSSVFRYCNWAMSCDFPMPMNVYIKMNPKSVWTKSAGFIPKAKPIAWKLCVTRGYRLHEWRNWLQCGAIITVFSKIPGRLSYGVSVLSYKSDICSTLVAALLRVQRVTTASMEWRSKEVQGTWLVYIILRDANTVSKKI